MAEAEKKLTNVYVPSAGFESWKGALADPNLHWKPGRSAFETARAWGHGSGLPPGVAEALNRSGFDALHSLDLFAVLAEHKTALAGSGRPSQADALAVAVGSAGLVVMAVEGKVSEGFDERISEWRGGPNKQKRLQGLCEWLGLDPDSVDPIRYQLVHRAASAVIEASRLRAPIALLLVHSFSGEDDGVADYRLFTALFGSSGDADSVTNLGSPHGIELYAAWVRDRAARPV